MRLRAMVAGALVLAAAGCAAAEADPGAQVAGTGTTQIPPAVRSDPSPTPPDEWHDSDGDGLPDVKEAEIGTDPQRRDSDGDGLDDLFELLQSITDPLEVATYDGVPDPLSDIDGDRLGVLEELDLGTDPLEKDTDGDGLTDGDEVDSGTDPLDAHDPGVPEVGGLAVLHDGGEAEVSVLAEVAPAMAEQIQVSVDEDHVTWRDSPVRLGPFVSVAARLEAVAVTLAYPRSVVGDLEAGGLLVIAESIEDPPELLDVGWDPSLEAFTVQATVGPDEYPLFVLVDRVAFLAQFD